MRTPLSLSLLFLSSLGLVACGGAGAGESSEADLTITMPDGTSTTLDFCEGFSLDAEFEFEFDPDLPPEVRNPEVVLKATQHLTDLLT